MKVIGFMKTIFNAFDKNRQIHEFKKKKLKSAVTIFRFLRRNMKKHGKTVKAIH